MKQSASGDGDSRLESGISYVLIIGVVTSLVLEFVGVILFYRSYGSLAISHERWAFLQGENFFRFLVELFSESRGDSSTGASMSRSMSFITLGIAVLILTPYVRALLSVFYF